MWVWRALAVGFIRWLDQRHPISTRRRARRAARDFLNLAIVVVENPCDQAMNETDGGEAHGLLALPVHAVAAVGV